MLALHGKFTNKEVTPAELPQAVATWLDYPGRRYGHLTARRTASGQLALEVLLLDTATGGGVIFTAPLAADAESFPALTPSLPAAHWAERAVGDMFGLRADSHPCWKSVLLHAGVWPATLAPLRGSAGPAREPYEFTKVVGAGVHEIPVGPIHAGIIEPGHFRFSCVGEIIASLEIRLGYQHRGVEERLTGLPWPRTTVLAESASSDTATGNALAHAIALEQLLGITPPPRAEALRTIALEVERLACHAGDLGALAGDIGYSPAASQFPLLRTMCLALGMLLAGTRLQRYYIKPGGVARDLDAERQTAFASLLVKVRLRAEELLPLLFNNPPVIERFTGIGRVSPELAEGLGLVGPAARASGSCYDARQAFAHGAYPAEAPAPARYETGDVLARAQVRAAELQSSCEVLARLIDNLPVGPVQAGGAPAQLAPNAAGIGVVEAWRGELIHWVTTDDKGAIQRYAIKDPSFNNWMGLALAMPGNLVADFPVCNKSFNLSYSGNDL
jgi:Ni,Fe-hydrogenase III large subunit/Ni,Fe-hydrogenase III component G